MILKRGVHKYSYKKKFYITQRTNIKFSGGWKRSSLEYKTYLSHKKPFLHSLFFYIPMIILS